MDPNVASQEAEKAPKAESAIAEGVRADVSKTTESPEFDQQRMQKLLTAFFCFRIQDEVGNLFAGGALRNLNKETVLKMAHADPGVDFDSLQGAEEKEYTLVAIGEDQPFAKAVVRKSDDRISWKIELLNGES